MGKGEEQGEGVYGLRSFCFFFPSYLSVAHQIFITKLTRILCLLFLHLLKVKRVSKTIKNFKSISKIFFFMFL